MPWCDDCAEYRAPNALATDGTCETCGTQVGEPRSTKAPWHFWLLVVAAGAYLAWRAVQGVVWLFG